MKISKLIEPKFKEILQNWMNDPLPLKCALKLKSSIEAIDKTLQYYSNARIEALTQFGNKNDDGTLQADEFGNVQFTDENKVLFVQRMTELLNESIDIDQLSVEEFGEDFKLSVNDLNVLGDLIKV